jgi:hypothetical protein
MKILAIGELTGADIAPHLQDEQRAAAKMRQDGFILESFHKRDRSGAILLVDEADAAAAERRLATLPFVERDLITFHLVELVD